MDERPPAPPEGTLIAEALIRTGLSIREASRRAGISYGRWRQITTGYQNVSPGSYAEVHAPAPTLARMAWVVEVTAQELTDAGRPDAAAALEAISADDMPDERDHSVTGLTAEEKVIAEAFVRTLREKREDVMRSRRAPGARAVAVLASGTPR